MSIGARGVKGILYSTMGNTLGYGIALFSSIVLARLLDPNDFGVVGLAGVIVQFIGRLKILGFEYAFMNRREDIEAAASTFLSLQLATSGLLIAMAALLSPGLALIYGNQIAVLVLSLASIDLLASVTLVYRQILSKELLFRELTLASLLAGLAGAMSSIALAMAGFGLWALVLGDVPRLGVEFLLVRRACPYRPVLEWDSKLIRWFLEFGPYWHAFVGGITSLVTTMLDNFLVGTLTGTRALGFYSRAFSLATLPTQRITWIISGVAYPIYAKLQGSRDRLEQAFGMALSFIFRLSLPLAVLLAFIIPELTTLLIGEKWLPLVPIFRLLVVYACLRPILDDAGALLVAGGELRSVNNIQFLQATLCLLLGPVLVFRFGATGAALYMDAAVLLGVLLVYWRLRRHIGVAYGEVFAAPIASTGLAAGGLWLAADLLTTQGFLGTLLLKVLAFTGVYLSGLVLLEGQRVWAQVRYIWGLARA